MQKLVITAALVGAEVTKEDTPHLPVTPDEIVQAAVEACQAGASIIHLHVRDAEGRPTQDKEIYREVIEGIERHTDAIIQVSTGGAVGMSSKERLQPLSLRPEMATLTTGTVNFGNEVFMNSPEQLQLFAEEFERYGVRPEFEIFDVGMVANALRLVERGFFTGHLHFDFVMGVPGAIPATPENLLHLMRQLPEGATWSVAGVGRAQLPMATLGILWGGHVRVGLEDNIYYRKGELATNTQLVERVVRLATELGRPVATPQEARQILHLTRNNFY
ncbi:3-keto-5-aminohexanoate cleavage protein [Laceyella sacchari]|jgi:3-keto-5-aminohexanoate cleavage enzyme|uniref:3-keto-5-aminohexanoate cleavage enzyme n=2 Tax=Laceyella TaxID=292635 RepID=A0AA45WQI1_9BACL|nr:MULTISPECIES: 3-keto-5-aminohexanoate cleavage protein [Laceyella]AUS10235.1 3-keto-5-aminohexanoate cleavage protein [Laceyella sacchari]MRG26651.1 3-keto-5-aminohexanoate cleavage protein [Laceyella tengchongensis]PRZ16536.1 3-keto-5-aminohexanoate cleavage enzyme [Laceyella sediminis]SMP26215.1 3-keto-5-aminohexanoate cleavage enzyme [Laceyella tengchongensis]